MVIRTLSSVGQAEKPRPFPPPVQSRLATFLSVCRMSWHAFYRTYSAPVNFLGMVTASHAAFGLETDGIDRTYSRWEAPNEVNYLDVLDDLQVRGGIYLGVATEPVNFTYIARVRPAMAILVDINPSITRIHLPLKGALLSIAQSRVEFLSMVLGRPLEGRAIPEMRSPEEYYNYFKNIPYRQEYRAALWKRIAPLLDPEIRNEAYLIWMDNFGIEASAGLSAEDVLLGKYLYWNMGAKGENRAWLASEEDFLYIRDMWRAGRIKGVTGDISGKVMEKIGNLLRQMGQAVSCFYISNCEDPLEIHGRMPAFSRALNGLPWEVDAQVIRYDFGKERVSFFRRCLRMAKVGMGSFSEMAFSGLSEVVTPEFFQ